MIVNIGRPRGAMSPLAEDSCFWPEGQIVLLGLGLTAFERGTRNSEKLGLDFHTEIYNHMVVDNLSAAFAALSDPTRRKILDHLTRGPAIVNDLVSRFEMSQQGISKHVAYLERARLIVKVKRGREHVCTLKVDAVREVAEWAEGYRRFWEARLDKFGEALARKKTGKQTKETKNGY